MPAPTRSEPTRPGPVVSATPSIVPAIPSSSASCSTSLRRRGSHSWWARAATSGITPPNGAWIAVWLATRSAITSRPPRIRATALSSQLDSIASSSRSLMAEALLNAGAQRRFNRLLLWALKLGGGHYQRIFAVIVVVANAPANFDEAER